MKNRRFHYYIAFCIICLIVLTYITINYLYSNQTSLTRADKNELARIRDITMVGDQGFPPLSFTDTQMQYSGYEADLVRALENRLSISIKYSQMAWQDAMKELHEGRVMAISGMRVTDTRSKVLHFTRPYFSTAYSMIIPAGEEAEALLKQPHLKIAVQKGSATYDYFFKNYHRSGIEYYFINEPREALELLATREVDMWVESHQIARYSAIKMDRTDSLEFHTIPGSSGNYAIAFGGKYGKLVPIFNKALLSLERDGTMAALDKKWFGVTGVKENRDGWFFVVIVFLFAFFLVVLIFSILSLTLKKMVDEKTEQHRLLLNNIPIQIWYLKNEDTYGLVNKAHANFLGKELKEIEGKKITQMHFSEEETKALIRLNRQVIETGETLSTEERLRDTKGNWHILKITRTPKVDKNGEITYIVCSGEDITERKLAEEALRESKFKIEQLHDTAIRMERSQTEDEVYNLIIKAAEGILSFKLCSVCVAEEGSLVIKATSSSVTPEMVRDYWERNLAMPSKNIFRHEMPIGDIGVFQVIAGEDSALTDEDIDLARLLLLHATESLKRIRSDEKIKYLSFHDSLTGLYNRTFFDQEMKRLDTPKHLPLSFIMGDLNGLKLVNDVFGHHRGDELLVNISRILRQTCREQDAIIRWGGDEIVILLPSTDESVVEDICQRIKKACLEARPEPIQPSMAIGTATRTSLGQDVDDCLKEAESKMYRNKLAETKCTREIIINSLKQNLVKKSFEDEGHAKHIHTLINKMVAGKKVDYSPDELWLIAAYHDIGMITVPDYIIKMPGAMMPEEWELVRRHPETGYRIAQSSPEIVAVADAILSHHEWWDGSGYPEGKKGEDIPLLSRMIAIADAYDVMTSGRPYKAAISPGEALWKIRQAAGTQFDPELVEFFTAAIEEDELCREEV